MVNIPEKLSRKDAIACGQKVYWKEKPCPTGHSGWFRVGGGCVECQKLASRSYKEENKKSLREKQIAYAKSEKGVNTRKKYMEEAGKTRAADWIRKKRNSDPDYNEKSRMYSRQYKAANAEILKEKRKAYLMIDDVKEKTKIAQDAWRNKNATLLREGRREYYRKYMSMRRKRDPSYKVLIRMRDFVRRCTEAVRGKKNWRTEEALGYSPDKLRMHIESLWLDGMSWENYGEWHIDHVTPINFFMKSGINDVSIINALENLQPLWAFDNLSKGAR